jgi:hypothetical protein
MRMPVVSGSYQNGEIARIIYVLSCCKAFQSNFFVNFLGSLVISTELIDNVCHGAKITRTITDHVFCCR